MSFWIEPHENFRSFCTNLLAWICENLCCYEVCASPEKVENHSPRRYKEKTEKKFWRQLQVLTNDDQAIFVKKMFFSCYSVIT